MYKNTTSDETKAHC